MKPHPAEQIQTENLSMSNPSQGYPRVGLP